MDEDEFLPRMKAARPNAARSKNYLGLVGAKTGKFRPGKAGVKSQSTLNIQGRGAAAGSLLAYRRSKAALTGRRVTVRVKRFHLRGGAYSRTTAHLHYIVRNGVGRDGQRPVLYGPSGDRIDAQVFARRGQNDYGHFAIMVSAEDGDQIADLRPLTHRLMSQVEQDLGTSLDWIAVDHFDTGMPHTHILLRGADEEGKPLLIARDYVSHGFRERAVEAMGAELGPQLGSDQTRQLRRETRLERPSDLDVRMVAESLEGGLVAAIRDDPFEQAQRTRRLRMLERLGLAQPAGALSWRLEPDTLSRLREIDRRVERLAKLRLTAASFGLEQGRGGHRISDAEHPPSHALVGALVEQARASLMGNMITLMIDGADGQLHHIEMASEPRIMQLNAGTIIRVSAASPQLGDQHDAVQAQLDQVANRLKVDLLSTLSLPHLANFDGPTWLDETLFGDDIVLARDAGFGRELRSAQQQRQRWLMEQGLLAPGMLNLESANPHLLYQENDKSTFHSRLLPALRQREFLRVAGQLSEELGLEYIEHEQGAPVGGTLRRLVDLSHGRFAVFEDGYQFRLVPWDMARKTMTGIGLPTVSQSEDGLDWANGRGRGGPSIS